jgi:acyl-coenzyme A thioesterase PaaI-like protein
MSLSRIPLLFVVTPTVVEVNEDRCRIKVPLNRMTRNHLGSMYFGALCIGADTAGAYLAYRNTIKTGVSLIFKDFQAQFLKRPEGDVIFTCEEGKKIADLVEKARTTDTRHSTPIKITATVNDDVVAEFQLTLSLKKKPN